MTLPKKIKLIVCQTYRFGTMAESCQSRGAERSLSALKAELTLRGLNDLVEIEIGPCFGYCTQGPNIRLVGHEFYHQVDESRVQAICNDIIKILASRPSS